MKDNTRTAWRPRDIFIAVSLVVFAWQMPTLHVAVIDDQAPGAESPRIKTLQDRFRHNGVPEIKAFWREVTERGVPLVESLPGDERHRLVTFLWQGQEDTRHVLIVGGVVPSWAYSKDSAEQKLMARLPGTDVWYKTYRARSDARVTYLLSPNDPFVEDKKSPTWQLDPLNPHRFEFKLDPENPESANVTPAVSVLSLPDAPPRRWTQPREGIARGKITETRIKSTLLGNERRLWIYTPPGYRARGNRYPLLVLFDGWEYLHWIPTPTILDNLLADRLISPVVAVLIDTVPWRGELACYPPFGSFMTKELFPWLRKQYHVTADPERTILAGSSLGGLAATCYAFENPRTFGKVLSQSGSFWWRPPLLWPKQSQSKGADDEAPEWLSRRLAALPRAPLQLYIEIGLLESTGSPSMLDVNRHLRNVLQAKGYLFRYVEFNGRHEFVNWQETLGDGLVFLLGKAARGRRGKSSGFQ